MEKPVVQYEPRDEIGCITLCNPERRNVLSRAALLQLRERLDEIEAAGTV